MKNPRILLVSPLPPPTGGITTLTSEYIKEMRARDYEVSIVNSSGIGNRISVNSRINYFDEFKRIIHIRSGIKKQLKPERLMLFTIMLHALLRGFSEMHWYYAV